MAPTRRCRFPTWSYLLAAVCQIPLFTPRLPAQQQSNVPPAASPNVVIQRADTSSPRATLVSFIDTANEIYRVLQRDRFLDRDQPENRALGARVLDCLDISQLPEFARVEYGSEAAVCIKEILDRVELPSIDEIPDAEAVAANGSDRDSRWRIPGTRITIARIEDGPQKHEYLFTSGTVRRATEYYQDIKHLPYRTIGFATSPGLHRWYIASPGDPAIAAIVDRLPEWTQDRWLGLTIWKWPGLFIAIALAVALMMLSYRVQQVLAVRLRQNNLFLYCLSLFFSVVPVFLPLMVRGFVKDVLTMRGTPLYIVSFGCNLTSLLAAIIVVFGLGNRIAELIIASPKIHPRGLDAQLIRIIAKLLSLSGVVVLFLEGGQYLGIPLTTLLASAGVSGLAVALAAQDTLKGLFGTIALLADKPFRVGERIVFQKYDGVVEDIGLRSTRIRLLTGNQATVPNDELARVDIENVGRRPHIRRLANIHIPLNTPRESIESAVEIIRELLKDHEGMDPDFPPRVYFNEFTSNSFNVRIIYWYHPPNYWDFLEYSQRFNFELCRAFEENGILFSLPERITYTSIDSQQQPLDLRMVDQANLQSDG